MEEEVFLWITKYLAEQKNRLIRIFKK